MAKTIVCILLILIGDPTCGDHGPAFAQLADNTYADCVCELVLRELSGRPGTDTMVVYIGAEGLKDLELPRIEGYDLRPYDEAESLPREQGITRYWISKLRAVEGGYEISMTYEIGTRCFGQASISTYEVRKVDGALMLERISRGCGNYFSENCQLHRRKAQPN